MKKLNNIFIKRLTLSASRAILFLKVCFVVLFTLSTRKGGEIWKAVTVNIYSVFVK